MQKRFWRAKGEKRELGLREDQGFGGRSSYLWFPSDQEEEGRLSVEESKDSKVRNKTLTLFSCVWVGENPKCG